MPELPEVETVCRGLKQIMPVGSVIESVELRRPDLRWNIPLRLPILLKDSVINGFSRRAKYILIETDHGIMIWHLGMSGSFRQIAKIEELEIHDHIIIRFKRPREAVDTAGLLVFNDPRRFGMLDLVIDPKKLHAHPRLRELGPEPLDGKEFSAEYLFKVSRKKTVAVKIFLMNQKTVVGIGNIYASEALFRAGVRPSKPAGRLSLQECKKIVEASREILNFAIKSGGSTIRTFRGSDGHVGDFQNQLDVYGRDGEKCHQCDAEIKSKVLGGRSTFWCSNCQK